MKIKRMLYGMLGTLFIAIGGYIIRGDPSFFSRFVTNTNSYVPRMETEVLIICLLMGIFYLYYAFMADKINKISNLSIIILGLSLISSWILFFGFSCFPYLWKGTDCPVYYTTIRIIAESLIYYGPIISLSLLIFSLFIRSRKTNQ
jgi:hypothetical protein